MTEPIEFPKVTRERLVVVPEATPLPKPELLRIPERCQSIEELLGTAAKVEGMTGALFIGWKPEGTIVYLNAGLSAAEANWMVDHAKIILLTGGDKIE